MPYLALLRTWTHFVVVEIPKHYCSCLTAQVGESLFFIPSSRSQHLLITPKGVCMLLQGQPSLLPPTGRICLAGTTPTTGD